MRYFFIFSILVFFVLIAGCSPKARYEKRLEKELASGVRHDSIFFGLYLGMPKKDFFTRCWNLNKQGLVRQGPNNASVEYNTKDELKYPATMDFYPTFVDDKISEMPVVFSYKGWAPWNKELSSARLQEDLVNWVKKNHGGGFITVSNSQSNNAYVKIDGNRRISIFVKDDLHVWVVFTDMLARKDTTRSGLPEKTDSLKATETR